MKKNIIIFLVCYVFTLIIPIIKVNADQIVYTSIDMDRKTCRGGQYEVVYIKASNVYSKVDKNEKLGLAKNVACYNNYPDAKKHMDGLESTTDNTPSILHERSQKQSDGSYKMVMDIVDTKHGFVNFRTKPSEKYTTNLYKETTNRYTYTYINGYYSGDGAFIEYNNSYDMAKVMISGFTGWVKKVDNDGYDGYQIVPISLVASPSYYTKSGIDLRHHISKKPSRTSVNYFGTLTLGSIDILKEDTKYYSFDGNYFYQDMIKMLDDYKKNSYEQSINFSTPYYNYLQFLPYRAKSLLDADALNQFIENRGYVLPSKFVAYSNESQMYGQGNNFIESSKLYGTNVGLTFSIALNESAYGRSTISMIKNNLFGHGAYDISPGESAGKYSSVKKSIDYHNLNYISMGYSDVSDYRYFGSHLGNKNSGMNVMYASDAYWGEKAAANYYRIIKETGFSDINNYLIGIKNEENTQIKIQPTKDSKTITNYENITWGNITNIPIIILEEVIGETIDNNNIWYKVVIDSKLDKEKNIIVAGKNYAWDSDEVTGQFDYDHNIGYVHSSKIWTEENSKPIITAQDKTIYLNGNYNPMDGVVASDKEDGIITNKIVIIKDTVDITKAGVYTITYSVTDKHHKTTTVTINITVKTNTKPILNIENQTILQYTDIDLKSLVTAFDNEDKNITENVIIKGTIDTTIAGEYEIAFSVTDSDNNTVTKTIKIIVKANSNPIIKASDIVLNKGEKFNPIENVTAFDNEDGEITSKIQIVSNNVNVDIPGRYLVTYKVIDSNNNLTTKSIKVIVDGNYIPKPGEFYFEKMEYNDALLEIEGFLTINTIDNKKEDNITFDIIFENQLNQEKFYEYELSRFLEEYPFKIDLDNGFNNEGAWFKGKVDISILPAGDYNIYIRTRNNGYESISLLKNIFSKDMVRKIDLSSKSYVFKVDYYKKQTPIYLSVREGNLIANSNPPTIDNMFNTYYNINLDKGLLNIKGTSFNVGIDYASNVNVERTLILEDIETKKRYLYDIGSITNGDYQVTLRVSDGLDKTRAWYNSSLNINSLPSGEYSMLIKTSVNEFRDYGEITDIFRTSKYISQNIDGREFIISRNEDIRYRMELTIK